MGLAPAALPCRPALLLPDAGGWRRRQLAGWASPSSPVCLSSSCQGQTLALGCSCLCPAVALPVGVPRSPLTRAPLSPWQGGR